MNKKDAQSIALNGSLYLARQVDMHGKFAYMIDEEGNKFLKYNILRHAGSIWAMKKVFNWYGFSSSTEEMSACDRASSYLIENFILMFPNRAYVLSEEMSKKTKLGGNALTILALDDERVKEKLINGLDDFIDFKTGQIRCSSFSIVTGRPLAFVSEYYPGEAAIALAFEHKAEEAMSIAQYLRYGRDKDIQNIRDHWLLQALEFLYFAVPEEFWERREFCWEYAKRIADRIMSSTDYMNRVTPMACMCEGLISYYKMSEDKVVLSFIEALLDKIAKYQKIDGKFKGAFFDSGVSRIDYTQHSICAFLRYSQLNM